MTIVYRISEKDYLGAHDLYVAGEKPLRRWSRRIMPWEGAVFLIIGVTSLFFWKHNRTGSVVLCLIGVYCLYCGFALRRYFIKRYRTDQRYKEDFRADISEEGIHFVTSRVESQAKWTSIIRYLESDEIFMLFHAALIFTIIPKRAFAPGEADDFHELLRRNVQPSK